MTENLNIHAHGRTGHISLNRPQAPHALTLDMCHGISAALAGWAEDDAVEAVILDHAEGRGFCAGGDINLLRHSALNDGGKSGREFFHEEYRLNHQMFEYGKPIVAFMDGITMGGGVGIALPCKYRVVTENTRFAMPESGIGLFPDVGGGWHLSRLGGRLGQFLALTGARLDGAECVWAGIATHYLPAEKLAEAKARIIEHPERIGGILSELSATPPPARLTSRSQTTPNTHSTTTPRPARLTTCDLAPPRPARAVDARAHGTRALGAQEPQRAARARDAHERGHPAQGARGRAAGRGAPPSNALDST